MFTRQRHHGRGWALGSLTLDDELANYWAMIRTINVAEFKNNLSKHLEAVEKGDEVIICRRNVPVARLAGQACKENRSKPGWGKGTVTILGDVEGPAIPEDDWHMLGHDRHPPA